MINEKLMKTITQEGMEKLVEDKQAIIHTRMHETNDGIKIIVPIGATVDMGDHKAWFNNNYFPNGHSPKEIEEAIAKSEYLESKSPYT